MSEIRKLLDENVVLPLWPDTGKLLKLIQPLFHIDDGMKSISEISFSFSPKQIKVPRYLEKYQALKAFLGQNGVETAQTVQGG